MIPNKYALSLFLSAIPAHSFFIGLDHRHRHSPIRRQKVLTQKKKNDTSSSSRWLSSAGGSLPSIQNRIIPSLFRRRPTTKITDDKYTTTTTLLLSSIPDEDSRYDPTNGQNAIVPPSMDDLWDEFVKLSSIYFPEATTIFKRPAVTVDDSSSTTTTTLRELHLPIPSEQDQLPFLEKLMRMAIDECVPWLLTFIIPAMASIILQSEIPLFFSSIPELLFLVLCSAKILTNFGRPSYPEPLLQNRDWDYVMESIWSSLPDVSERRKFLMGWFYRSAPFEDLTRDDAIVFLTWIRFGMTVEQLNPSQRREIERVDLPRLERAVFDNDGGRRRRRHLPPRREGQAPLPCLRFNLEPLRYRHKPLIFYALSSSPALREGQVALPCLRFNLEPLRYRHKPLIFYGVIRSVRELFTAKLSEFGFRYHPPSDPKTELGYWYRAPSAKGSDAVVPTPLVFIHSVSGIAFYYQLIERLSKDIENSTGAAMVLLDLPFVSLTIADDIPAITDQIESICSTLDKTVGRNVKSTFVGHSFGSIVLSWMAQSRPDRVANMVFLDPICFQLHLCDTLFNFHMLRADRKHQSGKALENPFSVDALRNLAGTEMHTNNAMLRHFSWATNALWPQDLERNGISAAVMLSEKDEIVPSAKVEKLMTNYQHDKAKKKRYQNNGGPPPPMVDFFSKENTGTFLRTTVMPGASHGEFAFTDPHRERVVRTVLAMMRLNDVRQRKQLKLVSSPQFPISYNDFMTQSLPLLFKAKKKSPPTTTATCPEIEER
eukprot:CAMPEP_0172518864 /NCGR_PEP_ID=MMETSP1066-20121228/291070_1 /TAXON_ID=671091 /ORGANISM="Coscinodiscus wailesii, Strain CCMP2513" /LENGTH=769 /DNA_ID=CAMNT_0013301331 /DNA_START=106 /DNA_END=2416 /DNA_ORIENTATION=-